MGKEKTHTLELSEEELAAILFLLYRANGIPTHQVWKRCRDILDIPVGCEDFHNKHKELSKECGYQDLIDYHSVEKEWEDFLSNGHKNKEILNKIIYLEKEIDKLKEML